MTDLVTPPEGFVPDPIFNLGTRKDRPLSRRRKLWRKYTFPQCRAKAKLFMALPKRERRARVVSLGWRIKQDVDGRGVFRSHAILPGSSLWPEATASVQQVSGILFLPRTSQPTWFYNASIETVALKWAQAIVTRAEKAVADRLTEADQAREQKYTRTYSKPLPEGGSRMWFAPRLVFESLGGHTADGARALWLREHWGEIARLVPGIGPSATLKEEDAREWKRFGEGVQHGRPVGLVTEEATLSVDGVTRALDTFLTRGAIAYQDAPVDFESVRPTVEAYLRGQLWRWDTKEAEAQGHPAPVDPDLKDWAVFDLSLAVHPSVFGGRKRKGRKRVS